MDFRKKFIDFAKGICPQNELGCYAALFLYMMTPWPISSVILITLLVGYATLGLDTFVNRAPLLAYAAGLGRANESPTPEHSEGVRSQVGAERGKSHNVKPKGPDHKFKMFGRKYREEQEHEGKGPKSSQ